MVRGIKNKFPFFKKRPLIAYLDNAATTQICSESIKAMEDYHFNFKANVHRGNYQIAELATKEYESAREKVAKFINAKPREIIFTSGTTFGLNFLAHSLSPRLNHKDNIVLSRLEHHSNLVPWQQLAKHYGFEIRFMELNEDWQIDFNSAKELIDQNTKIVSFSLASNVLGVVTPAKELITLAKNVGAVTILDAAQAAAHIEIDVKKLNCDFLVFSGHKIYGPSGIGILFGKQDILEENLEPFFYGGEMVSEVNFTNSTWAPSPNRFEPGTPNIAGAIGIGAAVDFLSKLEINKIKNEEEKLLKYALSELSELATIFGPTDPTNRIGIISFNVGDFHPHDVSEIINREKIATRSGFHCAEPLHSLFGLNGSSRISLGIYNDKKDIDLFINAIEKVKKVFLYV